MTGSPYDCSRGVVVFCGDSRAIIAAFVG